MGIGLTIKTALEYYIINIDNSYEGDKQKLPGA